MPAKIKGRGLGDGTAYACWRGHSYQEGCAVGLKAQSTKLRSGGSDSDGDDGDDGDDV